MKQYSQGLEQIEILKYFKDKALFNGVSYANITFLDIGSNNGITLSNTYALALMGAVGVCVEPSKEAFTALKKLHEDKPSITCLNVAVSDFNGPAKMQESGQHLGKGDTSLLSTLNQEDYEKWKGTTEFKEVDVDVVDFKTLLEMSPYKQFQMISIDCEGNDLICLQQMNLKELDCELLCIEHNGNKITMELIKSYCFNHGLKKILLTNGENIILCKP